MLGALCMNVYLREMAQPIQLILYPIHDLHTQLQTFHKYEQK